MSLEESRRSGVYAMDSRLTRFLKVQAKPKVQENRENLIEYTEDLIKARDHRTVRFGFAHQDCLAPDI